MSSSSTLATGGLGFLVGRVGDFLGKEGVDLAVEAKEVMALGVLAPVTVTTVELIEGWAAEPC